MKLWALEQYEETLTDRENDRVIGAFESKEEALSHISDGLPQWAEYWKTTYDKSYYTNGVHLLVRYVAEINTGEIFDVFHPNDFESPKKRWGRKAETVLY